MAKTHQKTRKEMNDTELIGQIFTVKKSLKKILPYRYKIIWAEQGVVYFYQTDTVISHIGIGLIKIL